MNILLFTHKNDIDGIGSVILSKLAFTNVDYILCGTFDLNQKVSEYISNKKIYSYEKIFITDLCLNEELLSIIDEDETINDPSIRGVGWYIDPIYQGKDYGTEAASAMISYMFNECEIDSIITGAAIENPASWKIMEKLGFERQRNTKTVQYTFLDEPTEDYSYLMTKDMYLLLNEKGNRK